MPQSPFPRKVYRQLMEKSIARTRERIANGEYAGHYEALARELHEINRDLVGLMAGEIEGVAAGQKMGEALEDAGLLHCLKVRASKGIQLKPADVRHYHNLRLRNLRALEEGRRRAGNEAGAEDTRAELEALRGMTPRIPVGKEAFEAQLQSEFELLMSVRLMEATEGLPHELGEVVFRTQQKLEREVLEGHPKAPDALIERIKKLFRQRNERRA